MSDIDKALFSTCIVFGLTEHQLDNAGKKKADRLIGKLTKIFEAPFEPKPAKRIGKYFINYDISAMTFGQYIELAYFLSIDTLKNAHYIIASISNLPLLKNNSAHHRKKSEYFLGQSILKVMGSVGLIKQRFEEFNNEYKSLFGLDKTVNGEAETDPFNKRYGWIYSASQVAEYERITLEGAFKLPIRQAFNDLAYLKAKSKYEADQLNKK